IVSLEDGTIAGAEALARWTHPELGPIAPGVFVPVAEETGLIDLLGDRVLAAATRAAAGWGRRAEGFRISVHVSPRQLERDDLLPRVERILAESGLPASAVMLELSESTVLSEDARTRTNLDGLSQAGIGIALDDFGTGYSSLSHLCR